jgi:hypothetical protein
VSFIQQLDESTGSLQFVERTRKTNRTPRRSFCFLRKSNSGGNKQKKELDEAWKKTEPWALACGMATKKEDVNY